MIVYSFDFKAKLRRLNPDLFVDDRAAAHVSGEWRSAGIYRRTSKREDRKSDYSQLGSEARAYLEDSESGNRHEFVTAVPLGWVPEFDRFVNGKLVARGWRTVLASLANRGLISLDRAKRVFNCPSLTESDYDRSTFSERVAWSNSR